MHGTGEHKKPPGTKIASMSESRKRVEGTASPYEVADQYDLGEWLHPADLTIYAQTVDDHVCFMNPWTEQYQTFSVEDKSSPASKPSEHPKKKPAGSRCSERRRAQNRTAQRKFAARKQQHETDLVDKITELERMVSQLGTENQELTRILESLRRLQRSRSDTESPGSLHAGKRRSRQDEGEDEK